MGQGSNAPFTMVPSNSLLNLCLLVLIGETLKNILVKENSKVQKNACDFIIFCENKETKQKMNIWISLYEHLIKQPWKHTQATN